METFCDGYVCQHPFDRYLGVTVDREFVTRDNFKEAVLFSPNLRGRSYLESPKDFLRSMKSDADIPRRLKAVR